MYKVFVDKRSYLLSKRWFVEKLLAYYFIFNWEYRRFKWKL